MSETSSSSEGSQTSSQSPAQAASPQDNFLVPDPVRPTTVPKLNTVIQPIRQPSNQAHHKRTRANTRHVNRSDISLSDLADTESSSTSSGSAAPSASVSSDNPSPPDIAVDADPEDGDSPAPHQPPSPPAPARRRPRRLMAPLSFADAFPFIEPASKAAQEARAAAEARRRGMMETVFDTQVPSHVYSASATARDGTAVGRRAQTTAAQHQPRRGRRRQARGMWPSHEDGEEHVYHSEEQVGNLTSPPHPRSRKRARGRRGHSRRVDDWQDDSGTASSSAYDYHADGNGASEGPSASVWATLVAQWREDVVRDVQAFARRCGHGRERVVYKCRSVGGSRAVQVLEAVATALGVEIRVLRRGAVWDVELIKGEGRVIAFGERAVRREAERAVDELVPAGDGLPSDASEHADENDASERRRALLDREDMDLDVGSREQQKLGQLQSTQGQHYDLQRIATVVVNDHSEGSSCEHRRHLLNSEDLDLIVQPEEQQEPKQLQPTPGKHHHLQRRAMIDLDAHSEDSSFEVNGLGHDAHSKDVAASVANPPQNPPNASPVARTPLSQSIVQTISLVQSEDDTGSIASITHEQPAPRIPARNDRLYAIQSQLTSEVIDFCHACKDAIGRVSRRIPCADGQAGIVPLLEAIGRKLDVRVDRSGGPVARPEIALVKESMCCVRWDDEYIRRCIQEVFQDLRTRREEENVADVGVDIIDVDDIANGNGVVDAVPDDNDVEFVGEVRRRPLESGIETERPLQRRRER